MHVLSKPQLKKFWAIHSDAESSLKVWYKIATKATWHNTADVRQTWNSVDFVHNLTVFNIGKNKYRLIARIDYKSGRVYIRHVLSHKEYDTNKWKKDEWY